MVDRARLDQVFAVVEVAAIAGERCPTNGHGIVNSSTLTALANLGKLRIEVFSRNWRVVRICSGPNLGKSTMPPPFLCDSVPYLVITEAGDKLQPKRYESHGLIYQRLPR